MSGWVTVLLLLKDVVNVDLGDNSCFQINPWGRISEVTDDREM